MSRFVLIHGAQHGGWCWAEVKPLLEAAGHEVVAPDLPALGEDIATPPDSVDLAMMGDFVADVVRAQPEPVILVGHSLGGISISEAAERVPDRILGLVYVTAMLVPGGRTPIETADREAAQSDAISFSPDGLTMLVNHQGARDYFYNCTDAAKVEAAVARLRPQPFKLAFEPMTVTGGRYGRVPRAYVECLQDNCVPLGMQRRMQSALPCDPVVALDTDHSPFFSMPEEFARALLGIGETFLARAGR